MTSSLHPRTLQLLKLLANDASELGSMVDDCRDERTVSRSRLDDMDDTITTLRDTFDRLERHVTETIAQENR